MNIIKMGPLEVDLDEHPDRTHSEKVLLHRVLAQLKHNEKKQKKRDRKIMTAIESLNQNVSDLTAAVTAAVADISTPHATDAQVQAAADAVKSNTDRLTTALNPTAPTA